MLKPVASTRVVDLVRDRLRAAILSGDLPPGTRLSVPELARQLEVSRSPVREAVLLLVGEGLAVEHTRRGVEVARLNLGDVLELYDLRASIDALAARLAAERMTSTDLTALRGVLDAQGAAAIGDPRSFRDLDARFHQIIVQTCGNNRVIRHSELLMREMRLAGPLLLNEAWHLRLSHEEHRSIERALRQRDGPAAETAMRSHLQRVSDAVRRHHA
ncbi:DNA-binding GntR family transcriptional regulator [Deinococcus metalli]|uniref:GntR family transcriptional regulator n=1 Tax=Deinococcus metalli TaxID=1141878 RepID=A0A7W8KE63_9DEIO|nr:GntR family transcriptional regulator [Deinococcus metalli]MBB5375361.1 DNA-binding GntR family transcriptional regulator [Deinococcus metalli]GHF29878.1 GntR family transcriptional regulator [Deinococcus metalli]